MMLLARYQNSCAFGLRRFFLILHSTKFIIGHLMFVLNARVKVDEYTFY